MKATRHWGQQRLMGFKSNELRAPISGNWMARECLSRAQKGAIITNKNQGNDDITPQMVPPCVGELGGVRARGLRRRIAPAGLSMHEQPTSRNRSGNPGSYGDVWTATWAGNGNVYAVSDDTTGIDQGARNNLALNRFQWRRPTRHSWRDG
jgi:hypothetical protein